MLIDFRFSRHDSEEFATDFDTGEIDMHIGLDLISSRKRTHMPNIIYMALYVLMDGVVSLQNGATSFQMEGTHSAFCVHFRSTKQGIVVTHDGRQHGPVSLAALIDAIQRGLAEFFADPLNAIPTGGAIEADFLVSWRALKQAMGQSG
ncbi:hypothetical protein F2P45_31650 [Massilia sp. CCM 8733]|uniref:Uncharacterized protein n=1 Tax=Massilia mucilaginosa TaxID=2609282 RepID=A0ABX0P361_9BURK|nr:hypothetical protein [Massilia mucilaginosa]NHZ93524.1 hypothetical protein [Massilia mucilaginosa]